MKATSEQYIIEGKQGYPSRWNQEFTLNGVVVLNRGKSSANSMAFIKCQEELDELVGEVSSKEEFLARLKEAELNMLQEENSEHIREIYSTLKYYLESETLALAALRRFDELFEPVRTEMTAVKTLLYGRLSASDFWLLMNFSESQANVFLNSIREKVEKFNLSNTTEVDLKELLALASLCPTYLVRISKCVHYLRTFNINKP